MFAENATLRELHLDNNLIEDLRCMGGNTTLRKLYVGSNSITSVESLRGNSTLTHLRLASNPIDCIDALSGITSMKSLGLDETLITSLTPLRNMLNLTDLSISGTNISDISPLRVCVQLRAIQMNRTRVSDMTPLVELKNLRSISASNNENVGDISFLCHIPNIERVVMDWCSVKHIPDLGGCALLGSLHLGYNAIESGDVWSCENGRCQASLYLSHNRLTNIDFVRGNAYIDLIDVSYNRISNIDVVEYVPGLCILNVSDNHITHIPRILPKDLWMLHINSNNIPDLSPLWGNTTITMFCIRQNVEIDNAHLETIERAFANNIYNTPHRRATLKHISYKQINS